MIRNIVFDIGNVLIGFDAMDYLVSLFGREKAIRIAEAVFGSGYWQELDIARLSEEEILELFYSGAPDLRAEIKESFDRIGECVRKLDWPVPLIDSLKEKGYRSILPFKHVGACDQSFQYRCLRLRSAYGRRHMVVRCA